MKSPKMKGTLIDWAVDLPVLVKGCFTGQTRRVDGSLAVAGKVHDVSIYRMSERLVRIDIKKQN